jgi:hypothetical protein
MLRTRIDFKIFLDKNLDNIVLLNFYYEKSLTDFITKNPLSNFNIKNPSFILSRSNHRTLMRNNFKLFVFLKSSLPFQIFILCF